MPTLESVNIEQWSVIPNFPVYAVSNIGRVKRVVSCRGVAAEKILSQRFNPNPKYSKCCYLIVRLQKDKKTFYKPVHQLVLEAFIGSRPDGLIANHKDGNKENNHISNLEWCTPSENVKHAFVTGLKTNKRGHESKRAKLKRGEVWLIRKLMSHVTQIFIAKMFGVDHSTISLIKCGRRYVI